MAVSGFWAFSQPFSIKVIGLHALTGFLFIVVVTCHVFNNIVPLKKYFKEPVVGVVVSVTVLLIALFIYQPGPVRSVLSLSGNLGPVLDRFEMNENGMTYRYSPAPFYKLLLDLRTGPSFDTKNPPRLAIWLENQSFYHIKTLFVSDSQDSREMLPFWAFKVEGWENAKKEAEEKQLALEEAVDGVSGATQNGSFDPADYILPANQNSPMPYRVMIEINQPGDSSQKMKDQPSLVYEVEVDNFAPRTFQLLELMGYPEFDEEKKEWAIYYVDDRFDSALEIVDSVLLQIERDSKKESIFDVKGS